MNSSTTKELGKRGEEIAADYLLRNGYSIIERNFENKSGYKVGELDIIARDIKAGEIAFVEVKTRRMGGYGSLNPELAITRAKYRRLVKIVARYLLLKQIEGAPHRIDAIAVELDMERRKARLKHLKYIYY